jgi:hypothetical protein
MAEAEREVYTLKISHLEFESLFDVMVTFDSENVLIISLSFTRRSL